MEVYRGYNNACKWRYIRDLSFSMRVFMAISSIKLYQVSASRIEHELCNMYVGNSVREDINCREDNFYLFFVFASIKLNISIVRVSKRLQCLAVWHTC